MSLPFRPGVRLNLTPNLLSPPKHINSDWVRVWWTSYILLGGGGGGSVERRLVEWGILVDRLN